MYSLQFPFQLQRVRQNPPAAEMPTAPMECVWLIAGLQPHLAWVTLMRLWCRAIKAPRINQLSTHTLRRESHCHGSTTRVLCRRAPAQATKVACGRSICYTGSLLSVVIAVFRCPYFPYLVYLVWVRRVFRLWSRQKKCTWKDPYVYSKRLKRWVRYGVHYAYSTAAILAT